MGCSAEVCCAFSIYLLSQIQFCFKDDGEPCHCAKLVTNWKCQNNIRTLTMTVQSLDLNPIENLLYKVALAIVKAKKTSVNHAQVDRPAHRRLDSWSSPLKFRHVTDKQSAMISKGWAKKY